MWNDLLQTINEPLPGWAGALLVVIGSILFTASILPSAALSALNSRASTAGPIASTNASIAWIGQNASRTVFLAANDRFTAPWWDRRAS